MNKICQLHDDQVDALDRRLLQFLHLLFDDHLKGDVRREQTAPDTVRILNCIRDFSP